MSEERNYNNKIAISKCSTRSHFQIIHLKGSYNMQYALKSRGRSLDSYLLYMSGKCYGLNNTDVARDCLIPISARKNVIGIYMI